MPFSPFFDQVYINTTGTMLRACDPCSWELEAEGPRGQDHSEYKELVSETTKSLQSDVFQ